MTNYDWGGMATVISDVHSTYNRRYFDHATIGYATAVILFLAFCACLERVAPIAYVYFIAEDRIVEYATSFSYFVAAFFFVSASLRERGLTRWLLLAAAFATFMIAGEEISWGQRILGIDTPEFMSGNTQHETTIHNMKGLQTAPFHLVSGIALAIGFMIAIVKDRSQQPLALLRQLPTPPLIQWPLTTTTILLLLFRPFVKGDEISEVMLAVVAMAWAIDLCRASPGSGLSARAVSIAMVGVIAVSLIFTMLFHEKGMTWRLNITASRDYPKIGMYEQAETLFQYILAHPEYMQADTVANHEAMLASRCAVEGVCK